MYKFNNILDYNTYIMETKWQNISKEEDNIVITDVNGEEYTVSDKNNADNINRIANRSLNADIVKLCGNMPYLEDLYGDNKTIHPLYNEKSKKFESLVSDSDFGYISYESLNLKEGVTDEEIENLFILDGEKMKKEGANKENIGKGEVLLSCLFPDVKITPKKTVSSKDILRPDCQTDNYIIEIKTNGAQFAFSDGLDDSSKNIQELIDQHNIDELKTLTYNSLAKSILERLKNVNKPLIFICYDNEKLGRKLRSSKTTGFFWLKYDSTKEKAEDLIERLKSVIEFSDEVAEHKNKFTIVAKKVNEPKDAKLICYCSAFKE